MPGETDKKPEVQQQPVQEQQSTQQQLSSVQEEDKKGFPWWIWVIVGVAIVAIGVVGYFLFLR